MRNYITRIYVLTVALMVVTLVGCRTSKTSEKVPAAAIERPATVEECYSRAVSRYGEWERLRVPLNVSLQSPTSASVSATAIMERDKSVLISLRVFGMEVGFAYVSEDSVLVVNKIKKWYFSDATARIFGGFPATVGNIQDLLLGRAFRLGSDRLPATTGWCEAEFNETSSWLLTDSVTYDKVIYGFLFRPYDTLGILMAQVAGKTPVQVFYTLETDTPYGPFMGSLRVEAALGKSPLSATLKWNFGKARWNSDVELRKPKIPQSYERVAPASISKMF